LYPLPEPKPPAAVLLVLPSIHVSTPAAFATLARPALTELTPIGLANKIERLQLMAWGSVCAGAAPGWEVFCENDFEAAVFEQAHRLRTLHRASGADERERVGPLRAVRFARRDRAGGASSDRSA